RPESHLNSAFSLSRMAPILHCIFLDDENYSSREDIQVYLEDMFQQIKEEHVFKHALPDPWPTPGMVYDLVEKSSGQFIYATTVIKYVNSHRHRPDQRLNAIFQLRPPFKDLPFTELDALYRLIISKAEDISKVLDILVYPALYGSFMLTGIEVILELEQGTVEVLLADLHSIATVSYGSVKLLHKSLADFLSDPQRAGDLYRDLSKEWLSHVARTISMFSILSKLEEPDNMKADYVSSEILQAAGQFRTSEFFKPLFAYSYTGRRWPEDADQVLPLPFLNSLLFIQPYFQYMYYIKDMSEPTKLVYSEQMRQYCKCALAVLDDDLSSNCAAHLVFLYYHLLHDPRYRLTRKLSYVDLYRDLSGMNVGVYGYSICHVERMPYRDSPYPYPYSNDITEIFHDLIGDIKMEEIFAKSASFCLALLCDEQCASQDTRLTQEARASLALEADGSQDILSRKPTGSDRLSASFVHGLQTEIDEDPKSIADHHILPL
ncbi:hypothetical protein CPC08DRAFT_730751, partial [Agrocybe pediades]